MKAVLSCSFLVVLLVALICQGPTGVESRKSSLSRVSNRLTTFRAALPATSATYRETFNLPEWDDFIEVKETERARTDLGRFRLKQQGVGKLITNFLEHAKSRKIEFKFLFSDPSLQSGANWKFGSKDVLVSESNKFVIYKTPASLNNYIQPFADANTYWSRTVDSGKHEFVKDADYLNLVGISKAADTADGCKVYSLQFHENECVGMTIPIPPDSEKGKCYAAVTSQLSGCSVFIDENGKEDPIYSHCNANFDNNEIQHNVQTKDNMWRAAMKALRTQRKDYAPYKCTRRLVRTDYREGEDHQARSFGVFDWGKKAWEWYYQVWIGGKGIVKPMPRGCETGGDSAAADSDKSADSGSKSTTTTTTSKGAKSTTSSNTKSSKPSQTKQVKKVASDDEL